MSSCPPGVICMDNMTVFVIIITVTVISYILYLNREKQNSESKHLAESKQSENNTATMQLGTAINIRTQGRPSQYEQIGILTRRGGQLILPLYGRELITGRSKYQYYTYSDQNNSVKLPVSKEGRSCTGEYGCDMLSNGDSVYVEGYNMVFDATLYENNSMEYIPFIY